MRIMSRPCLLPLWGLLIMYLVAGCVTPVTPEQIASADYGTVPPNYKEAIQGYMQGVLFDPYSAHYRFIGEPVKGYAYVRGSMNAPEFGYLVLVGINAKNRYGAYVGEKPYFFLFRNEAFWRLEDYTVRELVK